MLRLYQKIPAIVISTILSFGLIIFPCALDSTSSAAYANTLGDIFGSVIEVKNIFNIDFSELSINLNISLLNESESQEDKILAEGQKLANRGAYKEAVRYFSEVLKIDQNSERALIARGNSQVKLRKYSQALRDYQDVLKINEESPYAYLAIALLYDVQGKKEKSLEYYSKVTEINRSFFDAYLGQAKIYYDLGDETMTEKMLTETINYAPDIVEAYALRGDFYMSLGKYQKALSDAEIGLEILDKYRNQDISDERKAMLYYNRGAASYALGEDPKDHALQDLNRAIQLDPNMAIAYKVRAMIYDDDDNLRKALKDYDQWARLEPDNLTPILFRGRTHAYLEQYSAALDDFNYILSKDKVFFDAYLQRGATYYLLGNYSSTLDDLSLVIDNCSEETCNNTTDSFLSWYLRDSAEREHEFIKKGEENSSESLLLLGFQKKIKEMQATLITDE